LNQETVEKNLHTEKQAKLGAKHAPRCKMCRNHRAVIKKYNINLCRRCFKDNAERIGFTKFN